MNAPERIWALADRRKHWQDTPPEEGQRTWNWKEYIHVDKFDAQAATIKELTEALEEISHHVDACFRLSSAAKIARAALAKTKGGDV